MWSVVTSPTCGLEIVGIIWLWRWICIHLVWWVLRYLTSPMVNWWTGELVNTAFENVMRERRPRLGLMVTWTKGANMPLVASVNYYCVIKLSRAWVLKGTVGIMHRWSVCLEVWRPSGSRGPRSISLGVVQLEKATSGQLGFGSCQGWTTT